jgi:hypothetical protein
MKVKWDSIIQSLMLIRLGQELGNHGNLASMIHDLIDLFLKLVK